MMRFKDVEESKRRIFYNIYAANVFTWLDEGKADIYDFLYFHNSYSKIISFLYKEVVNNASLMSVLISSIIERYKDKWNRLYDVLITKHYEPLENYSMEESEKSKIANVDSVKSNSSDSGTANTTNDNYGFNSTTAQPVTKSTDTTSATSTNSVDGTKTTDSDKTLTRKGNIGVTTSQQMLESEVILRNKYLFQDIIFKDLDDILMLDIY
ncbi:MAG: hypothetical protein PUJ92_00820 [Bacilli bacterium]|nr:hypothetical protein [Bacilli bacterium]MDY5832916.1 hypothetical protein [Candidatus Onthovivens sp.]